MNRFVESGYERIEDDNYQTVDPRCTLALFETMKISGSCVDVCSPSGSGIVSELINLGVDAQGISDAFTDFVSTTYIVSNPPYKRALVDKIIYRQIQRIPDNQVKVVCMLLRTGFDHAKTRVEMFKNNRYYSGQIKMLFRPKWFLETDVTPIHNYVWHIWSKDWNKHPCVWYW